MANAALAHINLFDTAEITASSSAASTPPSMLQNVHVANKWRGTGGAAESVFGAHVSNQSEDTFSLRGITFGTDTNYAAATYRLRLSASDPTCVTGLVTGGDSGIIAGAMDYDYRTLLHLAPALVTGWKYFRWDLALAGTSFIEAGRGINTTRTEVTYNYVPGAQLGRLSNTKKTKSRGGQTYVDRSTFNPRVVEVSFGWISEAQRWAQHERIDLDNLDHTDILFIEDTASNNPRGNIWGLADSTAVIQPFLAHPDLYSKPYRIEERG